MTERTADIERARDAVKREAWAEAYEELANADPADLEPSDFKDLADAAFWLSRSDESVAAMQRAQAGFGAAGDDPAAAFCAIRLAFEHFERGEPSVGAGWLMRAQRHLSDQPECVQHGFLALCRATVAHHTGDPDGAAALAQEATRIGQRFGDPELVALGIHIEGLARIAAGDMAGGMSLLDEAMTSVLAGELGGFFTGVIFCNVLGVCLEFVDLGRASEWSEAAKAWCRSLPPESPYPGLCRIDHAAVADLHGDWEVAQREALRVSEDLGFNPWAAAKAFYETGELRRRIGNVAGAEEAFARAHELGFEPQPGLALLRLAQGKPQMALSALTLAVNAESESRPRRARLLAALVEAAIEAGDLEAAQTAGREVEEIARHFGTPALDAQASTARGALHLAGGDVPGALERLRHALGVWQELKLPYESARARMRFGAAAHEAGDAETARLEWHAALTVFERLGAAPDAREASALLAEPRDLPRGLTPREVQVLRLVAAGKTNREIATELVLSEHTVGRHLQNIFAKLGVSSRAAATASAFEHGLV